MCKSAAIVHVHHMCVQFASVQGARANDAYRSPIPCCLHSPVKGGIPGCGVCNITNMQSTKAVTSQIKTIVSKRFVIGPEKDLGLLFSSVPGRKDAANAL